MLVHGKADLPKNDQVVADVPSHGALICIQECQMLAAEHTLNEIRDTKKELI